MEETWINVSNSGAIIIEIGQNDICDLIHATISHLWLLLDNFATISFISHICNYIVISLWLFWFSFFHVNNI